jgi:phospholipid-translocating ATPase
VSRERRRIRADGTTNPGRFMSNRQRNQKYNLISFVPVVLFNQFKFFYNSFFLFIALSQFYPPLKVGFMFTYIAPLAFVLAITLIKEAADDIQRYRKDKDINNTKYEYLLRDQTWRLKASSSIKVGDILKIS